MLKSPSLWPLAIPMVLVGAAGVLLGMLTDDNWRTSLRQNLPSEMVGVSAGVLATVFIVDRLLKQREHTRWAPVRSKVFSAVRSNAELALRMVNPYLKLEAEDSNGQSIAEALAAVTAASSVSLQLRIDDLLARDVLHSVELLTPRVEEVLEAVDSNKFVFGDRPDLVRKWLDLQHAFEMLRNTVHLEHSRRGSPTPGDDGPKLAEHSPIIAFPLLNTIRALAKLHYAATD